MYALVSFLLTFISLPFIIKHSNSFFSPIKPELEEHMAKAGTPAFGSIGILFGFSIPLFFKMNSTHILFISGVFLFFFLGFMDDFLKVRRHSSDGLPSLAKLAGQIVISLFLAILIKRYLNIYEDTPAFLYYPAVVFYITLIVNAVNITDGLDTLAVKTALPPLFLFSLFLPEPFIFAFSLIAFLFYNAKPARTFMGDGGSHIIGVVLSLSALISGYPILMLIALLPFLAELLSSFIQIFSIRVFKRKVFPIAPFHHALEKSGISESRIADSFLVSSLFFSLICGIVFEKGLVKV